MDAGPGLARTTQNLTSCGEFEVLVIGAACWGSTARLNWNMPESAIAWSKESRRRRHMVREPLSRARGWTRRAGLIRSFAEPGTTIRTSFKARE